jgi:GTP pyrophosphokinase
MAQSIYGDQKDILPLVMENLAGDLRSYNEEIKKLTGHPVYEHMIYRIKSEESMREKCTRKNQPKTPYTALRIIKDSIGIRVVTGFVDDIFKIIDHIRAIPGCQVVEEKDYIRNAKPNGYRSYHMIIEMEQPYPDVEGREPGLFFVEFQIRTIAMDCWASLEHELKYKKTIKNQKMLQAELKRCADELASCDVTMQTIKNLIREGE